MLMETRGFTSIAHQPFLRNDEIAVVHVRDAVPGGEQVTGNDFEADGVLPEIPPVVVPDPDREAERVPALSQRERTKPAHEVLLLGAVVRRTDRVGRAEADDGALRVQQLELDPV